MAGNREPDGDPQITKKPSDEEHSQSESDPIKSARNPTKSKPPSAGKGKSTTGPRKLGSEEEKETGGKKLKEVEPDKTPAKKLRVWSQDDVILILEGMLEYSAQKKSDPVADWDAFFHFIINKLHVDVTRRQLQGKISKLKERYNINKKKERRGRQIIFPDPREELAYELSKSIWGNKVIEDSGKASSERPPSKSKGSELSFPASKRAKPVEDMVLSMGNTAFEKRQGVDEWNKLKMEEVKTYIRHLEIKAEQTKLVLGCLKSAGC